MVFTPGSGFAFNVSAVLRMRGRHDDLTLNVRRARMHKTPFLCMNGDARTPETEQSNHGVCFTTK